MMTLLRVLLLVCGLTLQTPPGLVAFGDSITVGYGAYSRAAMWTERMGVPVENLAVAGSTVTEQVAGQITPYAGRAMVALWFSCTNDLFHGTPVAEYRATLDAGVRALQARGMVVYLGTCLRPASYAAMAGDAALHDAYSAVVRDVAVADGAVLVDIDAGYDPATMERTALPYHPNDEGHAFIARAFAQALRRRLWLPDVRRAP